MTNGVNLPGAPSVGMRSLNTAQLQIQRFLYKTRCLSFFETSLCILGKHSASQASSVAMICVFVRPLRLLLGWRQRQMRVAWPGLKGFIAIYVREHRAESR